MAAPPERGRANQALVGLLATELDVPAGSIRVVGGRRSRAKVVEIDSLELEEVERRLTRSKLGA